MNGEFERVQSTSKIHVSTENEFSLFGANNKQLPSIDKHLKRNVTNANIICDRRNKAIRRKFLFEKYSKKRNCKMKSKKFSCEVCGNKLGHTIKHSGDKQLECDTCKKISFNSLTLPEDTDDKNYVCDICKKLFMNKLDLKRHLRTHNGEKSYICKICLRCFITKAALNVHYLTHTGGKPYTCDICHRSFKHLGSLKYHNFFVHNGPECPQLNICHICGSSFKKRRALLKHKLIHKKTLKPNHSYIKSSLAISTKNSLEPVCGSEEGQLKPKDDLKADDNIQSECKLFMCHSCPQVFTDKETFQKHFESTHTNKVCPIMSSSCGSNSDGKNLQPDCCSKVEEKFICDICDEQFNSSDNLKIHFKIHTEQKYYVCEVCQLCFIDENDLRDHENFENCVNFHTCKICGEKFVSKIELETHCKTHVGFPNEANFSCSFSKPSDLDQQCTIPVITNIKSVSETCSIFNNNQPEKDYNHPESFPHYCELCNKNFSNEDDLKQHNALHTEEKSYVCPLCLKLVSQKSGAHVCKYDKNEKNSILFQALQSNQVQGYICRLCLTAFMHRHAFEHHMFQHTKEHECKTCGKRFFTADSLAIHCEQSHKPPMHPCIACKAKFLNKKDLIAHCFSHLGSGEYFICSLCKQCFKGREDLQKHNPCSGKTDAT